MNLILNAYNDAVKSKDIEADTTQLDVVRALDLVLEKSQQQKRSWFQWRKPAPVKGLYLYGPVGVGKTFLMDLFFQQLPKGLGLRFHFHHFMQQVDHQLRRKQGQKDPLQSIAKELSARCKIICFDEFMVHDVAYAMILTELFTALFNQGLVLVATSNTLPDHLYANGIQRARFLPTIDLIKQHCKVMTLVARRDYRLNRPPLPTAWFHPADSNSEAAMNEQFDTLKGQSSETHLQIQKREVACKRLCDEGVWFEFEQICNLPRSQLDYLELANRFSNIFMSHIPHLGPKQTSQAVLFIYFVDIMYDHGVRLVLSSQETVENLCSNPEVLQEFKRTHSRLKEMQSVDYARRHQHRKDPSG